MRPGRASTARGLRAGHPAPDAALRRPGSVDRLGAARGAPRHRRPRAGRRRPRACQGVGADGLAAVVRLPRRRKRRTRSRGRSSTRAARRTRGPRPRRTTSLPVRRSSALCPSTRRSCAAGDDRALRRSAARDGIGPPRPCRSPGDSRRLRRRACRARTGRQRLGTGAPVTAASLRGDAGSRRAARRRPAGGGGAPAGQPRGARAARRRHGRPQISPRCSRAPSTRRDNTRKRSAASTSSARPAVRATTSTHTSNGAPRGPRSSGCSARSRRRSASRARPSPSWTAPTSSPSGPTRYSIWPTCWWSVGAARPRLPVAAEARELYERKGHLVGVDLAERLLASL